MPNISENIRKVRDNIRENRDNELGKGLARDLQLKAIKALKGGILSRAWAEYMESYVTNPKQLTRLIGEDLAYNAKPYADETLVYIVANATCGTTTIDPPTGGGGGGGFVDGGGTMNNLNSEMLGFLDDGAADPVTN